MSRIYYLISSIIGAELALIFFELSRKYYTDLTYTESLIICLCIIALSVIICLLFQQIRYLTIGKFLSGTPEKKIAVLEKKIAKSGDKVLKSKLYLRLSQLYIEVNDFHGALKAIKRANPYSGYRAFNVFYTLPRKYKLVFYIKSIYLNIILNNLMSASNEISYGNKYLNKYINDSKYNLQINKVFAMLEYSKGDYSKAEDYISSALANRKNIGKDYELYFILGKIFLKTNRYSLFKNAMEKVIDNTESEQLLKAAKQQLLDNIR